MKAFPLILRRLRRWFKKKKKQKLLYEIIPRFGLLGSLKSDNGHHLLLRLLKGFLKHWALLIISIVPGGLSLQEK